MTCAQCGKGFKSTRMHATRFIHFDVYDLMLIYHCFCLAECLYKADTYFVVVLSVNHNNERRNDTDYGGAWLGKARQGEVSVRSGKGGSWLIANLRETVKHLRVVNRECIVKLLHAVNRQRVNHITPQIKSSRNNSYRLKANLFNSNQQISYRTV